MTGFDHEPAIQRKLLLVLKVLELVVEIRWKLFYLSSVFFKSID